MLTLLALAFLGGLVAGGAAQPLIDAGLHPDLTIDSIRAGGFGVALHAESESLDSAASIAAVAVRTDDRTRLAVAGDLLMGYISYVGPARAALRLDQADPSKIPEWTLVCFDPIAGGARVAGSFLQKAAAEPEWTAAQSASVRTVVDQLGQLAALAKAVAEGDFSQLPAPPSEGPVVINDPRDFCSRIAGLAGSLEIAAWSD